MSKDTLNKVLDILNDKKVIDKFIKGFEKELKKKEKEYKKYIKKYFKNDLKFIADFLETHEVLDSDDIIYKIGNYSRLQSIDLLSKHLETLSGEKTLQGPESEDMFEHYRIYFSYNNILYCKRTMYGQGEVIQIFKVDKTSSWDVLGLEESKILIIE